MPAAKYTGNPGGGGNPPGKYSKGYLGSMNGGGHFVGGSSYRGGMHVGISGSANDIGNQPKQNTTSAIGMRTQALP